MLFNGIWGGESVRAEAGRWECENIHRRAGYLRGRRITGWTWKITRTEWKWNYCIWRSQQLFWTPTIAHKKKKRKSWFTSNRKITFSVDAQTVVFRYGTQPLKLKQHLVRAAMLECRASNMSNFEKFVSILGYFTWLTDRKTPNSFSNQWERVFM